MLKATSPKTFKAYSSRVTDMTIFSAPAEDIDKVLPTTFVSAVVPVLKLFELAGEVAASYGANSSNFPLRGDL